MTVKRLLLAAATVALASVAHAQPTCRSVEARFTAGAPGLQIVVWVEDASGRFVDTLYVTRATGQFGLGNRPGAALLKTDFRWPYGRREMVFPVWAHRRDKHYPRVVMGGVCGNSPSTSCPGGTPCGGQCEDSTVAYHERVSSYEPYFCSPSGASRIDAMSCASQGTFSKGAFADPPAFSLYPPRADLSAFNAAVDSPDIRSYAGLNDLVAVSAATPRAGVPAEPVIWYPSESVADGEYVLWVEVSQEFDFNAAHDHPNQADSVKEWDFVGKPFLGQPSVVYRVPFRLDGNSFVGTTRDYAGYGAWDGSDGRLRPPDTSITADAPGTGAGRLIEVDGARITVSAGACGGGGDGGVSDGGPPTCVAPGAVRELTVTPAANTLTLKWLGPSTGAAVARYEVRYHEGAEPITDDNFDAQLAPTVPPPSPGAAGVPVETALSGLVPERRYAVAVRAESLCGAASPVAAVSEYTTQQKFTTLKGCFVATAAWGSADDRSVEVLRRFRDRHLETSPAGQLFVAVYYAFSPSLAAAITGHDGLRAAVRRALAPLVTAIDGRQAR